MHCEELNEMIPLFIVDLLDEEERLAVRKHLDAGCPSCASELAAAHQTLDLLPLGLKPEAPSPMVKSRLMANIRNDESLKMPKKAKPAAPAPPPPSAGWTFALAAGVGGALVGAVIAGMVASQGANDQMAALRAELDGQKSQILAQANELASVKQEVVEQASTIRMVKSPMVKIFDMAMQAQTRSGSARIFWDKTNSFWQMYAEDLPALEPGRVYQLWFITPTAKVSAGMMKVSPAGDSEHRVTVPSNVGLIVAGAITDEPEGGSIQPTGRIRFLGEV